ncbi:MAG: DPP IV N-terminal domain-containing protein, partial [Chitinophagaceae bacterium]
MHRLILVFVIIPLFTTAQKKQITLEDIYKKGTFRAEVVPNFPSENVESFVDISTVKDEKGRYLTTKDFLLSADKKRVLFFTGLESIYRRSTKANVYLHDIASKKTTLLDTVKLLHATFSPDGSRVAYVKSNNLYIYDIDNNATKAVTTDGKWNYIINGNCDWVYEEEF